MPPGPAIPPVSLLVVVYALLLFASIIGAWVWAIVRLALGLTVIPRFDPRVVPWRGPAVLLVTALWLAVQAFGPSIYLRLHPPQGAGPQAQGVAPAFKPSDMMIASAIENTALLLILPLVLGWISGARPRDFLGEGGGGLRLVRALQGVAAWPLIAPAVYGAMLLAVAIWGKGTHPLERAIQTEGLGEHAWVFFLASVALAPMAEELVFRGAILGWLNRLILLSASRRAASSGERVESVPVAPEHASAIILDGGAEVDVAVTPLSWPDRSGLGQYSPPTTSLRPSWDPVLPGADPEDSALVRLPAWGTVAGRLLVANILVSALFAGLHFAVWPTPVPIFFLSLVLGLLYQRTGSLLAPVALHMTFNGISTVLMFLAFSTPPAQPGAAKPKADAPHTTPVTPTTNPVPVPVPVPAR